MAQCLLIDDSSKLSAIHALNLRIFTGVDVIWKPDLASALEVLEIVPNIDLIIAKSKILDVHVAREILAEVSNFEIPPTIISLGSDEILEASKNVFCLSPVVTHQELILKTAQVLGVTAKDMANLDLPEMYEVPISYLNYLDEIVCPMFLLTTESDSGSSQFVEVGTTGDTIAELKENLSYYLRQGAKRFFVPTTDRLLFVNSYTKNVLATLGGGENGDKKVSQEQRMEATAAAMDAVSSDVVDHGFNEKTINLARESIKSLTKFAKANTGAKVFKLLATFLKQKVSYRFKRVQLTIMLINEAVKHMEWGAAEHVEKLSYVAFFHDILLYKDEMAKIHSDEELENSSLGEKDKRIVRHHALWALDLMKDYPETHMGATVLIKQHHGSINGIGFNENPGSNVSPLAVVFIICEAYATEVLKMDENEGSVDHKKILNILWRRYQKSNYQKIIKSLQNIAA